MPVNSRQRDIDIAKTKLECLEVGESFITGRINRNPLYYSARKFGYEIKMRKSSALTVKVVRLG